MLARRYCLAKEMFYFLLPSMEISFLTYRVIQIYRSAFLSHLQKKKEKKKSKTWMAIMCSCIYWSSVRGFLMLSGIHVSGYIKAWFSHAAVVAATELPVLHEKLLWEHIATGNNKHCRFLSVTWMWRNQILLQQETSQVFTAGWTWVNFVRSQKLKLGWPLLPVTSVFIGTVSQVAPAAMLQVARWHMRTTLQA